MLEAGKPHGDVAKALGKTTRTISNWWRRHKSGLSLEDKPRSGRPSSLKRVAKIIISKSVGKRHKSTRKLARRITNKGCPTSKTAIHRYLTHNLGLRSYKRPHIPRLSEKPKIQRIKFCKERLSWPPEQWENVIFSDESPFHLFEPSNPQIDRVWSSSGQNIPPILTTKFPSHLMVWGAMSARAVSELHFSPPKCTVNAWYYVDNILAGPCLDAFSRKRSTGTILQKKFCENMYESIFQQDGAPVHTSKLSQQWCQISIPNYWAKEIWPGNSPDLSPIENLWALVKQRLSELPSATNLETLKKQLEIVWADINPGLLKNLIDGMSNRIRKCLELHGGYIGK